MRTDRREIALVWTSLPLSLLVGAVAAIAASAEALELSGLHGLAAAALAAVTGLTVWIVASALALVLAARLAQRLLPPQRQRTRPRRRLMDG